MSNSATAVPTRKVSARKPVARAAAVPATSKTVKASAPIENEAPLVSIADIRGWMSAAEQKLEMAYDAAEPGEPIDTLLDHIAHNVLLEPWATLQREDLTQSDARRVYDGLFPVLACIQGAIKLAHGTVLRSILVEAFGLLDAAQTALDSVNDAVRALPFGGAEHDFERGRDLAVSMLRKGSSLWDTDGAEAKRWIRSGQAQNRFALEYIEAVAAEPALTQGFAAVLSARLGVDASDGPDYYVDLPMAEFCAGAIGANGTQTEASDAAAEPHAQPDTTALFGSSYSILLEAVGVLEARIAQQGDLGEVAYGAMRLARACATDFRTAQTLGDHERISAPLGSALAVLIAANEQAEDTVLYGAIRLLSLCKESFDSAIGEAS